MGSVHRCRRHILPQELMSIVGRRFSAESSTTPHAVRFGHPIIM